MTEKERLECTDPTPMLEFLRGKASDRKLRLFAVETCRNCWSMFPNDQCREAISVAEQFADGTIEWKELWAAREAILNTRELIRKQELIRKPKFSGIAWATVATDVATIPVNVPQTTLIFGHYRFLHDIFGFLPFRPVAIDPRWLTSTVLDLATAIYAENAFGRLPILADALMDAGCDSEEIVAHCRSDGPHVKGCWVVDLLLGKQ